MAAPHAARVASDTQDAVPPVPTNFPAVQQVSCNRVLALANITFSECGAAPQSNLTDERVDGACPFNYTLLRHLDTVDDCGNTASYEQTLSVMVRLLPAR